MINNASDFDVIKTYFDGRFARKNGWYGVRFGRVTTPPSEDPLKLDRIRCWWSPLPKGKQSDWCRHLSLGQGYKSGIFMPPKLGDEVMLLAYEGDQHNLYYLTHSSTMKPLPDEHLNGDPSKRWCIRTLNGHIMEIFEDPNDTHIKLKTERGHTFIEDDLTASQRIELTTIENHDILMNDVSGQQKIKITEKEGRYIDLNTEQNWIDLKTLTGNRMRFRDSQQDILLEHPSGSYIWFKPDGDVILHAEKTLTFTSKSQVNWPEDDLTWKIPATTHKCVEEGVDYIAPCPAPERETKCFNCETGEETGETPENPNSGSIPQKELEITNPSDTWTLTHNQNRYPPIQIIDENGFIQEGAVQHVSKNETVIHFTQPQIGKIIYG